MLIQDDDDLVFITLVSLAMLLQSSLLPSIALSSAFAATQRLTPMLPLSQSIGGRGMDATEMGKTAQALHCLSLPWGHSGSFRSPGLPLKPAAPASLCSLMKWSLSGPESGQPRKGNFPRVW